MRMDGNTKRAVVDMEGIQLVYIPNNTIPIAVSETNKDSATEKSP